MKAFFFYLCILLASILRAQIVVQPTLPDELKDFEKEAAPLIDAFYNAHYDERERQGSHIFQLVLPIETQKSIIATPNGTHVRVFMGWNTEGIFGGIFRKEEAQTVL